MTISPSKIPEYLACDAVAVSIYAQDMQPFRAVSIHELQTLIAADQVYGVVRGRRLKYCILRVPLDVAGRTMGESRFRGFPRGSNAANQTTQRVTIASRTIIRHHAAHCSAWRPDAPKVDGECV